jgi:endonuclease-3
MDIDKTFQILKKSQEGVRRTNLNRESKDTKHYTPFQTLISCILSLRVRDEVTEVLSKDLFEVASTPEGILKIPAKKLEKIIFRSGYYRVKAKTIKHISKEILDKYNGKVPDTKEELLSIKGIGPKTANIVLCFAFNQVVIPVDVNLHRVSNRLGWVKTNTAEKTEKELEKILPKKYWREINGIFILHGKKICVPISPKCSICPINKLCPKVRVKKQR